jgi:small subunit ribosomal protein S2
MEELPTALVVVDPKREKIAVSEAYKLRIPIVAMLDTDCDPDQIDIPVPANSDAIRSVSLVMSYLGSAVIEGRLAGGFSVPQGAEAGVAPESAAAAAPA